MGVASLVLGILALISSWIPFICFISLVFAIIGLILGIVDTIKKNKINDKTRGISIAGLIISAIAIPIIIMTSITSFVILSEIVDDTDYDNFDRYDLYDDYDLYDSFYKQYYNTISYEDII